jgi:hypothetical protein
MMSCPVAVSGSLLIKLASGLLSLLTFSWSHRTSRTTHGVFDEEAARKRVQVILF